MTTSVVKLQFAMQAADTAFVGRRKFAEAHLSAKSSTLMSSQTTSVCTGHVSSVYYNSTAAPR